MGRYKRDPQPGDTKGKLTIIEALLDYKIKCFCSCNPDVVLIMNRGTFFSPTTHSCGCYRNNLLSANSTRHGLHKHPAYTRLTKMLMRCNNPKFEAYKDYGARGIIVCKEWSDPVNYKGLKTFVAWFEERLKILGITLENVNRNLHIDRINNNGPYAPWNCRLVSHTENAKNTRRNRIYDYNGQRKILKDWALELGLEYATLKGRLDNGWDIERAFTAPLRKVRRRKQDL